MTLYIVEATMRHREVTGIQFVISVAVSFGAHSNSCTCDGNDQLLLKWALFLELDDLGLTGVSSLLSG